MLLTGPLLLLLPSSLQNHRSKDLFRAPFPVSGCCNTSSTRTRERSAGSEVCGKQEIWEVKFRVPWRPCNYGPRQGKASASLSLAQGRSKGGGCRAPSSDHSLVPALSHTCAFAHAASLSGDSLPFPFLPTPNFQILPQVKPSPTLSERSSLRPAWYHAAELTVTRL